MRIKNKKILIELHANDEVDMAAWRIYRKLLTTHKARKEWIIAALLKLEEDSEVKNG